MYGVKPFREDPKLEHVVNYSVKAIFEDDGIATL
jgi:hypothetical protein